MGHRVHVVGVLAVLVALSAISCGDTDQGGVPSEYQTVDEFLGSSEAVAEAEYQAYIELQARIEGMLVECMDARGLEYSPYEGHTGDRPVIGAGLTTSEFLLEYGYGVFTSLYDDARWNTKDEEYEGLEPDEWYWSFADDPAFMEALDECTNHIEIDLGRPEPGYTEDLVALLDEAWEPVSSEFEGIAGRIEKDDRYLDAERGWSACMAEKGHDFDSSRDPEAYLTDRRAEFEEAVNLGTVYLTDEFEKDIGPYLDEELEIAAADAACRTDLDRVRLDLQREYEGLFIDKHHDRFIEIRELDKQLRDVLMQGWQW